MKIAIAGVGKIALDQHVPAIAASPDWELAATVSLEGSVAGVPAYDDFDMLLAQHPDIGTVSICLPPIPRYQFAEKAIRAGRHVMLEKPPGATLSECRTLEAMAREKGVSIYATWHSREAEQVDKAREWLKDKHLKRLSIIWKEDVRRWHPGQTWIWQPGGLGVFDPTINALSILTEILPVPVHVVSSHLDFPENCQTPIAGRIQFYHPDGANVTADIDFLKTGEQIWTIEAETNAGLLVLSGGGSKLEINGEIQGDMSHKGLSLVGEYPRLYRKMTALIRAGGIDMDLSPMEHVADALLLCRRKIVEPFHE